MGQIHTAILRMLLTAVLVIGRVRKTERIVHGVVSTVPKLVCLGFLTFLFGWTLTKTHISNSIFSLLFN